MAEWVWIALAVVYAVIHLFTFNISLSLDVNRLLEWLVEQWRGRGKHSRNDGG